MSGSFGELGSLLKQAQKMQRDLDKAREELRNTTVEGTAGAGAVRVVVTGDRQISAIEISQETLDTCDKEMIEDLVLAALRDGTTRAAKLADETMGKVTGGVNLPGLF